MGLQGLLHGESPGCEGQLGPGRQGPHSRLRALGFILRAMGSLGRYFLQGVPQPEFYLENKNVYLV